MKQNLIADYLSCILFRAVSFFTCFLPLSCSLFLGRRLGDLIYFFDRRHRALAYAHIRKALLEPGADLPVRKITRRAYQAFGQNLIEISFIPRINKKYLEKYITIENRECIDAAFERGKGVIFLAAHEGNWELSNIICANLGFPFVLFVRDQGFVRLNALLNSYRLKQGAKIIHKQAGVRQLIEALKSNQAIGMTVDQGGKIGERVEFFGKDASMSTGAVKLALKYDCAIIPVFYTRVNGPYTKVILDQVYTVKRSGNADLDLRENLQRLIRIYEKYIRQYPHEYLWTYKIWKYGRQRQLLILSDAKTGHLRQSESAAKLIQQQLIARGINSSVITQEVNLRSCWSRIMLKIVVALSGKYQCQGCLRCLRFSLRPESWKDLSGLKPDIIISAGSSLSAVNYFLAKENQAKSIVLMRPGLSLSKFDLVIAPRHDRMRKNKRLVSTEGALNLVDAEYLKAKSASLKQSGLIKTDLSALSIGVLIGGKSKAFNLSVELFSELITQIKKASEELSADILFSTSRRTDSALEQAAKASLAGFSRCKLLVIANENNHPDVVGGILGLSNIIIISPESISMISEAVASGKYVFVFEAAGLSRKHRYFLKNYQKQGYIYLTQIQRLASAIKEVWRNQPKINLPGDNLKVSAGLEHIL